MRTPTDTQMRRMRRSRASCAAARRRERRRRAQQSSASAVVRRVSTRSGGLHRQRLPTMSGCCRSCQQRLQHPLTSGCRSTRQRLQPAALPRRGPRGGGGCQRTGSKAGGASCELAECECNRPIPQTEPWNLHQRALESARCDKNGGAKLLNVPTCSRAGCSTTGVTEHGGGQGPCPSKPLWQARHAIPA